MCSSDLAPAGAVGAPLRQIGRALKLRDCSHCRGARRAPAGAIGAIFPFFISKMLNRELFKRDPGYPLHNSLPERLSGRSRGKLWRLAAPTGARRAPLQQGTIKSDAPWECAIFPLSSFDKSEARWSARCSSFPLLTNRVRLGIARSFPFPLLTIRKRAGVHDLSLFLF